MPYRVLLADGSPIIQNVVEDILVKEGFEVRTVSDAGKALEEIDSFVPHVIFADIALRGIDGYCLCKEIKTKTISCNTPVILLAGAYEPYDEEYAKIVGVDDYILKPFESLELVGKLKKMLKIEGHEAYAPPPYSDDAFIKQPSAAIIAEDNIQSSVLETVAEITDTGTFSSMQNQEIKEPQILLTPPEMILSETGNKIEFSMQLHPDELKPMLKQPLDELIAYYLSAALPEEVSESLKGRLRSAIYEIAPEIIEEILRQKMNIMISSLINEIDAEVKNALPVIVEKIIRRKFEKVN